MDPERNDSSSGGRSGPRSFLPRLCRSSTNLDSLVESLSRCYTSQIGASLAHHEYNFVLTDPRLPDHPIVFASEGFLRMSGYERHQVMGQNCRFLQGPDTDRGTVAEIRDAIREERACQVRILNYNKEGTAFWNLFHLAPVFASDGRVVHYVGVQTPIANELANVGTYRCKVEDTPFRGGKLG
uniref:Putative LOV domain-containing protein n=1 Tax=Fontinalis antipyretica TaxID=67435 RepID=A0A126WW47_9BRYO|nr:putative LOV domain-containing protein [Fontinalis antipyretica]